MKLPGATVGRSQPLYILIAQRLIEAIEAGDYAIGDLLPTEMALAANYGVSRHTTREAVRELVSRGMVQRRQGVGTRVTATKQSGIFAHNINSIRDLLQAAENTRLAAVTMQSVLAEPPLTGPRKFRAGQKLLRFQAMRVSRDNPDTPPVSWTQIYVIDTYAGVAEELDAYDLSVGELIERRYGEVITEIEQNCIAVNLEEAMAEKLICSPGTAALRLERWYYGRSGQPFEYTIAYYPENRFNFTIRLTRNTA